MTWRERAAAAREREQAWFWRRWPAQMRNLDWPFTRADHEAWTQVDTCLAGEVAASYGWSFATAYPLFHLGDRWLYSASKSAIATDALLDQIEDAALELKRSGATHG